MGGHLRHMHSFGIKLDTRKCRLNVRRSRYESDRYELQHCQFIECNNHHHQGKPNRSDYYERRVLYHRNNIASHSYRRTIQWLSLMVGHRNILLIDGLIAFCVARRRFLHGRSNPRGRQQLQLGLREPGDFSRQNCSDTHLPINSAVKADTQQHVHGRR